MRSSYKPARTEWIGKKHLGAGKLFRRVKPTQTRNVLGNNELADRYIAILVNCEMQTAYERRLRGHI